MGAFKISSSQKFWFSRFSYGSVLSGGLKALTAKTAKFFSISSLYSESKMKITLRKKISCLFNNSKIFVMKPVWFLAIILPVKNFEVCSFPSDTIQIWWIRSKIFKCNFHVDQWFDFTNNNDFDFSLLNFQRSCYSIVRSQNQGRFF